MALTQDPTTWGLEKGGRPVEPAPLKGAETQPVIQPKDRAGVITVKKGALRTIRTYTQYALADHRYHGDAREDRKSYRPFPKSATSARRAHTASRRNYKEPLRSYIPKAVVLSDQPALNIFDMARPYLASAVDDQNPTPALTIEEGIPDTWEKPARIDRMHKLFSERHDWHKSVSKTLDAQVPYRDHIVNIKKHKQKTIQHGIASHRGQLLQDLIRQGAQYSGRYATQTRPPIMPVSVP